MLPVLQMKRLLRLTRSGSLLPWLGPTIRGIVARDFKRRVCHFTPQEQEADRLYCKGCPSQGFCPYGDLLEPDPPPGAVTLRGQESVVRPMVLSPALPTNWNARLREIQVIEGTEIPITATFVGLHAAGQASYLWEALAGSGRAPGRNLGSSQISFDLLPYPQREETGALWGHADLPLHPKDSDLMYPWVRVSLLTPLFLRSQEVGKPKQTVLSPSFSDLLRASLRTLGSLAAVHAEPLQADFAALKQASEAVEQVEAEYQSFTQSKASSRGTPQRKLLGVLGHAVFANVPGALLAWLAWGGTVHVGGERVMGAGSWKVQWSDRTTAPSTEDQWEDVH